MTVRRHHWQEQLRGYRTAESVAEIPRDTARAEQIVEAASLAEANVPSFATRHHFADVAEALERMAAAATSGVLSTTLNSTAKGTARKARAFRLALAFRATPSNGRQWKLVFGAKQLRSIVAKGNGASFPARKALAALGEPVAPWPKLTREERAAQALAVLIDAWHGAAS